MGVADRPVFPDRQWQKHGLTFTDSVGMENDNPFVIDDTDLVGEWIRQPILTRNAGRDEADARHAFNMAKAALDVLAARLRFKIRQCPEDFGLTKPNLDDIAAAIIMHPEHVAAVEQLNVLKRNMDYMSANTSAMLDRRKALERRVELLALLYHAEKEPQAISQPAREYLNDVQRRAVREPNDGD
jgi:hypothetical protein